MADESPSARILAILLLPTHLETQLGGESVVSPPDPAITCPWCGVLTPPRPEWDATEWKTIRCLECSNVTLLHFKQGHAEPDLYPSSPKASADHRIPSPIRDDFIEAQKDFSIGSHKSAVVMCRRALQAAAVEKGATKGKKLWEQIDELANQHVIIPEMAKMAHQIRLEGNIGAHPDEDGLEDIAKDDATEVIDFTEAFLAAIYVIPRKVEEVKTKRGRT